MPTPLIVDVDTGIDDALALSFLARSPLVSLRAVTCVAGNTDVDQVVRNTLDVLDLASPGHQVPVARGAECPLVAEARPAHGFHGENGIGGLELPRSDRTAAGATAVEVTRQVLAESSEPLTLLALGPLTNVALLIRAFPALASRLERIVFMGGAVGTDNATTVAKFNAWQDPEAVSVVVHSPIPTTMYGLDVFYDPVVAGAEIAALEKDPDPGARLVGQLLAVHARQEGDRGAPLDSALGDAGAACLLADPATGTTSTYPVGVELAGGARGQTVVDRRPRPGESELHGVGQRATPIEVVTAVDATAIRELFLRTVREGGAG